MCMKYVRFSETRINLDHIIVYTPCQVQDVEPAQPDAPDQEPRRVSRHAIRFETPSGPVAVKFNDKDSRDECLMRLDAQCSPEVLFSGSPAERPSTLSNQP